jgi:hypothetical protein
MFGYISIPRQVGQTEAKLAIVTCPPCSYLRDGECVVCMDGEPHPGCSGCVGGTVPWYRSPFAVSLMTSLVVSSIATVVIYKLERRLKNFF